MTMPRPQDVKEWDHESLRALIIDSAKREKLGGGKSLVRSIYKSLQREVVRVHNQEQEAIVTKTIYALVNGLVKEIKKENEVNSIRDWLFSSERRARPRLHAARQLVEFVSRHTGAPLEVVERTVCNWLDRKMLNSLNKNDEAGDDRSLESPSRWTEIIMCQLGFGSHKKVRTSLKSLRAQHDRILESVNFIFTHVFPVEREVRLQIVKLVRESRQHVVKSIMQQHESLN